jgi:hypothetical protein
MTHATLLWLIWQALPAPFGYCFSRRGIHSFFVWITALAINVEQHSITILPARTTSMRPASRSPTPARWPEPPSQADKIRHFSVRMANRVRLP